LSDQKETQRYIGVISQSYTPRWRRIIGYPKRYLQQSCARRQKESTQDRAAKRTARATIWIAVFTVVLAGVGIYQGSAIWGQLAEARYEQRAWIFADISPGGDLEWFGQLQLPTHIRLQNTGHSPAQNIRFGIEAKAWGSVLDTLQYEKELCRKLVKWRPNFALFPAQTKDMDTFVVISEGEIEAANKKINRTNTLFVQPILFSCVAYTIAGDDRDHYTGDVIGVDASLLGASRGGQSIHPNQTLPQAQVHFEDWIGGGSITN
jgi:hypothetical protein